MATKKKAKPLRKDHAIKAAIDGELHSRLVRRAEAEQRSEASVVRQALQEFLG